MRWLAIGFIFIELLTLILACLLKWVIKEDDNTYKVWMWKQGACGCEIQDACGFWEMCMWVLKQGVDFYG